MNDEKYKYDFLRYNLHHVLRPNALLLLILVYLCKDIILVMFIGVGSFKGGAQPGVSNLVNLVSPKMILSDLPAIAVAFSLILRTPNAGNIPRIIWKHGRSLIALSVILHILLMLMHREFQLFHLGMLEQILIGLDILTAVYVFSSRLVKDIFAEFPAKA